MILACMCFRRVVLEPRFPVQPLKTTSSRTRPVCQSRTAPGLPLAGRLAGPQAAPRPIARTRRAVTAVPESFFELLGSTRARKRTARSRIQRARRVAGLPRIPAPQCSPSLDGWLCPGQPWPSRRGLRRVQRARTSPRSSFSLSAAQPITWLVMPGPLNSPFNRRQDPANAHIFIFVDNLYTSNVVLNIWKAKAH
jgi:hypothetical protein